MYSGLSALYLSVKLTPIFFEAAELINKGTPIDSKGFIVITLLAVFGTVTYFLALGFQLAQKRVVKIFCKL
jgi:hypothetical protein